VVDVLWRQQQLVAWPKQVREPSADPGERSAILASDRLSVRVLRARPSQFAEAESALEQFV